VGSHSLNDDEQRLRDLLWDELGAEDPLAGPLRFAVATANMSVEMHDIVARILDAHPGRRRVIFRFYSGGRKPTDIVMQQRCSASVVEPMVQFLGRYAV
jgi:hypothetical protein